MSGHRPWSEVLAEKGRPRLTEGRLNAIIRHKDVGGNISAAMADELISELRVTRGALRMASDEVRFLSGEGEPEGEPTRECPTCHRTIVVDARGGPHPSPGDHDSAIHVARNYGTRLTPIVVADGTRGMERGR